MPSSAPIEMADVYRFLAAAMRYPQLSWKGAGYFSTLYSFLNDLGWEDDYKALCDLIDHPDWLESLQEEHTRLFINATPHVIAPPYGSVYSSGNPQINGPTTGLTRNFYQERGYDLANEHDLPDSLTSELEFLALLSEENYPDDEERFLRTLFRPWFELFRDKVLEAAQCPYYKILVRLIDFFTKEEARHAI